MDSLDIAAAIFESIRPQLRWWLKWDKFHANGDTIAISLDMAVGGKLADDNYNKIFFWLRVQEQWVQVTLNFAFCPFGNDVVIPVQRRRSRQAIVKRYSLCDVNVDASILKFLRQYGWGYNEQ